MAISIDQDLCENTGVCAMVCPEDVIEIVSSRPVILRNESCTNCWICVEHCVSGAIEID